MQLEEEDTADEMGIEGNASLMAHWVVLSQLRTEPVSDDGVVWYLGSDRPEKDHSKKRLLARSGLSSATTHDRNECSYQPKGSLPEACEFQPVLDSKQMEVVKMMSSNILDSFLQRHPEQLYEPVPNYGLV